MTDETGDQRATELKGGIASTYPAGFADGMVHYTDDVLFGEVWARPGLSPRDRSLVTVAALVAGGNAPQLEFHLPYAVQNGVTREELIEAITHLAFYAGWPKAMSALAVARSVFSDAGSEGPSR